MVVSRVFFNIYIYTWRLETKMRLESPSLSFVVVNFYGSSVPRASQAHSSCWVLWWWWPLLLIGDSWMPHGGGRCVVTYCGGGKCVLTCHDDPVLGVGR